MDRAHMARLLHHDLPGFSQIGRTPRIGGLVLAAT
jgi:hypothetical protein